MKLRSALLAVVLALVAFPVAQAQGPGQETGGASSDRRMQMMFKDLTLTTAQKARVDSIAAHYRTQPRPVTAGSRPDSGAMGSRRAAMQKLNAAIRAVLTAEQQPIFDRNVEEMRNAVQRRQGGR